MSEETQEETKPKAKVKGEAFNKGKKFDRKKRDAGTEVQGFATDLYYPKVPIYALPASDTEHKFTLRPEGYLAIAYQMADVAMGAFAFKAPSRFTIVEVREMFRRMAHLLMAKKLFYAGDPKSHTRHYKILSAPKYVQMRVPTSLMTLVNTFGMFEYNGSKFSARVLYIHGFTHFVKATYGLMPDEVPANAHMDNDIFFINIHEADWWTELREHMVWQINRAIKEQPQVVMQFNGVPLEVKPPMLGVAPVAPGFIQTMAQVGWNIPQNIRNQIAVVVALDVDHAAQGFPNQATRLALGNVNIRTLNWGAAEMGTRAALYLQRYQTPYVGLIHMTYPCSEVIKLESTGSPWQMVSSNAVGQHSVTPFNMSAGDQVLAYMMATAEANVEFEMDQLQLTGGGLSRIEAVIDYAENTTHKGTI